METSSSAHSAAPKSVSAVPTSLAPMQSITSEQIADRLADQQAEIQRLRKAARNILPYLKWTISAESPGHHPTMPSAVRDFETAFTPVGAN